MESDLEDKGIEPTNPRVLHVALCMENPLVLNCDFNNWDAQDLFEAANMKVTGQPMLPPSTMYLKEQRALANGAWKVLRTCGYDKDQILVVNESIKGDQCHSLNETCINQLHTMQIRQSMVDSRYDAIVYKNDYEWIDGEDSTTYIIFEPWRIKSLEPTYEQGQLITLS